MRKFILLVLLAILTSCGSAFAAEMTVDNVVSFDEAIRSTDVSKITITPGTTINLNAYPPATGYPVAHTVTIEGGTLVGNNTKLFDVNGAGSLTLNSVSMRTSGADEAVYINGGRVSLGVSANFTGNGTRSINLLTGSLLLDSTVQFSNLTGGNEVIWVQGGSVTFPSGVNFENCSRATLISGGTVMFNGTKFVGNKAGAVSISGGNVTFTDNAFQNNTGAMNGGAISITGGTTIFSSTGIFEFTGNSATGNGGAIYNTTSNAIPKNATFSNNVAADNGGAIYTTQSMRIEGGTYSGNKATSGSGGTIYSTGGITMSDTTLSRSTAGTNGGAVYAGGTANISGSVLSNNEAGRGGGAVYAIGITTITDSVFGSNVAATGGAISCPAITATGSSFRSNTLTDSSGAGGAIYIEPVGGVTAGSRIERCLFVDQLALGNGGAVMLQGNNTAINIHQSHFEGNSGGRGGALYLMGSDVEISRSTFDGNKATGQAGDRAGQGGAAFLESASTVGIVNSTFYENESAGPGGAVYFDVAITGDMSAIYYSTFVNNKSGGGGGALYTQAGTLYFGATAMVGNIGRTVSDLLRESTATISSLGYNIVESYGVSQNGNMTGNYQWGSDPSILGSSANKNSDIVNSTQYVNLKNTLFGSNALASNALSGLATVMTGSTKDSAGQVPLKTIALVATTATQVNPALDKITGTVANGYVRTYFDDREHVDERGVPRGVSEPQPAGGSMADVGAFELPTEDGGGPDPGTGTIAYVVMGGIPNTMVRIGQNCTLTAVVYGQNGQAASNQSVTWESSRPRVARIDEYGNLVSLSEGTTTITVTTVSYGTNNERKSASAMLTVSEAMTYNNVHPDVLGRFADFNETLNSKGVQVYFHDADPAKVEASSFAEAFVSEYNLTPRQVTSLASSNNVDFVTNPTYSGSPGELRPSVGVSAANFSGYGSLLPLRYVYSLSWNEVSSILGRTVTSASTSDIRSLFGKISLVFVGEDRTEQTVLDSRNVSDALSNGALNFTSGGTLSLQIDALIGDAVAVGRSASGRADMIDGILVVADNLTNQKIDGEMWLVGKSGSSSGGSGDGGGGCSGLALPALLVLFAPAVLTIGRRKE